MNLIQRWFSPPRATGWDLGDYPPFELPHPGSGAVLSESQARQNWVYWQATLAERQRLLRDWLLAHHGPDPQALQGTDYSKALKAWAKANFAKLPAFASLPKHKPWPDCTRSGPFIVYSLLGDLAASLGEAIIRGNGHWRWGLNLDATDLADDMATSRRVVLLADLKRPTPEASEAVLDLEDIVFSAHRFPESVDFIHLDKWSTTVGDAIAGRHYDF
ncbi:hypothetical protein ASD88_25560 [Pelomonas sp. Root662]|nr:hypothetical protein ASC81_25610 [Pelomonas sp. Root405]KRA76132.1 hypothetical protein ASD88_25560 [Pelomonas sp. Root662]